MACFYVQDLALWVSSVGFGKLGVHMNKECFATTKLCCLNIIGFEICCGASEPKLNLEQEVLPNSQVRGIQCRMGTSAVGVTHVSYSFSSHLPSAYMDSYWAVL